MATAVTGPVPVSLDERLLSLIKEHSGTPCQKVLLCAQDVADDLMGRAVKASPVYPGMPDLAWYMGIDVVIAGDSAPGTWRLVRHDHCEVIHPVFEPSFDDVVITPDSAQPPGTWRLEPGTVSHEKCTIIAESGDSHEH